MKVLTLIFILVFGLSVFGQAKSKTVQSIPKYQSMPFNSDIENLPPHFLGHNAASFLPSLFSFALEIIKGCGKFEKTEPCQNRLNGIYDRPISSTLNARDRLAFSIPVDCDYSANFEEIKCSFFLKDYDWSHKLVSSKTYIGENAFGVKKLIHYKKFENIEIQTDKIKPEFLLRRIPPENARLILPHLRYLIIGTLSQPFVKTDPISYKPTLDDPEHIDGNNYSLIIEAEQVWLYDFESGKILSKETFGV